MTCPQNNTSFLSKITNVTIFRAQLENSPQPASGEHYLLPSRGDETGQGAGVKREFLYPVVSCGVFHYKKRSTNSAFFSYETVFAAICINAAKTVSEKEQAILHHKNSQPSLIIRR